MGALRDILLTMPDLLKVQRRVPKEVIDKSVQAGYDIPAFHGTTALDAVLKTNEDVGGTLLPGTEHYGVHVGPLNTAISRLFIPRFYDDPSRRLRLQEAFDRLEPYRTFPESNTAIMPLMVRAENMKRVPDVGHWDDPYSWYSSLRHPGDTELDSSYLDAVTQFRKEALALPLDGKAIINKAPEFKELKKRFADTINRKLQMDNIDALIYQNMFEGDAGKDSLMVVNPGNIRTWDAEFNPEHKGKMGLRRSRGGLACL